jgi:hypothetical protein
MLIGAGVLLLLAGVLGGGFEIQRIKVPALGMTARAIAFATGAVLILTASSQDVPEQRPGSLPAHLEPKAQSDVLEPALATTVLAATEASDRRPSSAEMAEETAGAIRSALATDQQASKALQEKVHDIDELPPISLAENAANEDRPKDLDDAAQAARAYASAIGAYTAAMRGIGLVRTGEPFRNAFQAHIAAWQGQVTHLTQMSKLIEVLAAELRSPNPNSQTIYKYRDLFNDLYLRYEEGTEISRTWHLVREAALAANVDPSDYEMP